MRSAVNTEREHLSRVVEDIEFRVPAYWLGLRWGTFTCVGWQVTLYDPIWQVTDVPGDPQSFKIRFKFESAVRFDSKEIG